MKYRQNFVQYRIIFLKIVTCETLLELNFCQFSTNIYVQVLLKNIMEMKKVIAREGREAKNLLLYHLSSEDESKLQ